MLAWYAPEVSPVQVDWVPVSDDSWSSATWCISRAAVL
jgi:hypothetical protein